MIELSETERFALRKLPLRLRTIVAPVFDWPDLAVDQRGQHWANKRDNVSLEEVVEVGFIHKKATRRMTMKEAAAFLGLTTKRFVSSLEFHGSRVEGEALDPEDEQRWPAYASRIFPSPPRREADSAPVRRSRSHSSRSPRFTAGRKRG